MILSEVAEEWGGNIKAWPAVSRFKIRAIYLMVRSMVYSTVSGVQYSATPGKQRIRSFPSL